MTGPFHVGWVTLFLPHIGVGGAVLGGGGGRGLDSDLRRQALSGLPSAVAIGRRAAAEEAARDARLAVFQAVPPFPVFVLRSPLRCPLLSPSSPSSPSSLAQTRR